MDKTIEMKQRFIELLQSTGREGVYNVILGLKELGFFEAPASSHHHLSYAGGLLEHSLNVYDCMADVLRMLSRRKDGLMDKCPLDSVIITSLLHDVCKSTIYKTRRITETDAKGNTIETIGYKSDFSDLPLGHGEKSVIMLLQLGLKLTKDEMCAIRWHMGRWQLNPDSYDEMNSYNACRDMPLCALLRVADQMAAEIIE